MSMPMDVVVSHAPGIGNAVESLRWIGVLRVVGATLVAVGVGLELVGEVLGHPSEQALRAAREAEIAGLTAQVEALRRVTTVRSGAGPGGANLHTTWPGPLSIPAGPVGDP